MTGAGAIRFWFTPPNARRLLCRAHLIEGQGTSPARPSNSAICSSHSSFTDLNFDPAAQTQFTDRINVSGTASLAGAVTTSVSNVPLIQAGDRRSVLVDAAGGLTTSGLALNAPVSAIARFSLATTPQQLALRAQVDFAGVDRSLNRNRTEVGDYFNRVQAAGSSAALAPVITHVFYTPDVATLGTL